MSIWESLPIQQGLSEFVRFLLIAALLIGYYVVARFWLRSRGDSGAVVTQYSPPRGLSPAAMRFVETGECDAKCVAATAVHLAARGLITFRGLDDYYAISRTAEAVPSDLPAEEAAAYRQMFNLDQGGSAPFRGRLRTYEELPHESFLLPAREEGNVLLLQQTIQKSFSENIRRSFISYHIGYSSFAAFLSFYFALSGLSQAENCLLQAIVVALGVGVCNYTDGIRRFVRGELSAADIQWRVLPVFFVLVWVWVFDVFASQDPPLVKMSLVVVVILNLTLSALLVGPTESGGALLGEIAGYRDFLCSVELDRMHRLKSPGWKPSAATANLAYAIALDLGDAWDDYLANAGFHTVVWRPGLYGMHKREIRTATQTAEVDWLPWVAFAAFMVVVVGATQFMMYFWGR